MRTIKLICVCLATYLPASILVAASSDLVILGERALREECSAFSQEGMRDCLAKKAESSQKALRQAEGKVVGILSKWDEDMKYISQAKSKLTASNNAFAKYRDSQCEFMASLSGGGAGNAYEMGHLACVAELNSRRAEQLSDAVSDLPSK